MKKIKKYSYFLNEEIDFKMKPVDYEESNDIILGKKTKIYTFKTKNDEYSLYFSLTNESNHLLSNEKYLYEYCNGLDIPTIYFSLKRRELSTDFDKLTGYDEQITVLGIVTYLINEFDMKYNYPVYSIGRVDTKKEKFYMYYLHNLNKFKILKGDSDSYQVGVYYLIKK
jgi:hypothetical protein